MKAEHAKVLDLIDAAAQEFEARTQAGGTVTVGESLSWLAGASAAAEVIYGDHAMGMLLAEVVASYARIESGRRE